MVRKTLCKELWMRSRAKPARTAAEIVARAQHRAVQEHHKYMEKKYNQLKRHEESTKDITATTAAAAAASSAATAAAAAAPAPDADKKKKGKAKKLPAAAAAAAAAKAPKVGKDGKEIKVKPKVPHKKGPIQWYPNVSPQKKPAKKVVGGRRRKAQEAGKPKLRRRLRPGTVVILLGGRYRGRRAIFVKGLPSGLILVAGPYSVNGIPLRRYNQAYVIATSTKVDISKIKVNPKFNDAFFKKPAKVQRRRSERDFFSKKTDKKGETPTDKKKEVREFDKQLAPLVKKVPFMTAYLRARFGLKPGQKPHLMTF
eukprot:TRINITY_DN942_c0_g1_i1.p1 TRINITY_DN942_c0_g1~~TRINITY_DN942_c0_g1_i1.p1  ORF type:complete len:312 (-),score=138.35 TRINITY_DN942_c0_g1_i1:77-1012(-)